MSFDSPRSATDAPGQLAPIGERRIFLTVLDHAVGARSGLACGIVTRAGIPVLHVINSTAATRKVEIGCDFIDGDWWYTWAMSGDTIWPVDDPEGVTDAIAVQLKVNP